MQANNQNVSIIPFIDQVLLEAITCGASDIHFEPFADHIQIRFRQDGILVTKKPPGRAQFSHLTTRLKILANLDIAERRLPQDGRFQFIMPDQRSVDFRVNTCPTLHGEKIVLRLLQATDEHLALESLGMNSEQQRAFVNNIHRAQGMVLVAGPTGSGKTITLYTALQIIKCNEKNISTVEDPIEIQLPGINQVQANDKVGLHFNTVLRAFLRQDPDVIMIGEIRDQDTAQVSIKASLTGHLVLSTLHTNSATDSIVRLINMGIAPYNIVSSVTLVMAQRLVRKLCERCKEPSTLTDIPSFEPTGCEHCVNGYKGREGIFQVMPLSDAMKQHILSRHDSYTLRKQAALENIMTLKQAGLEKVARGITSLSEINRVISE